MIKSIREILWLMFCHWIMIVLIVVRTVLLAMPTCIPTIIAIVVTTLIAVSIATIPITFRTWATLTLNVAFWLWQQDTMG